MIGHRVVLKRGGGDEAEKPFWISFADLMTALMVLFLVSLSVALIRAQAQTEKAVQAQADLAKSKAEIERQKKELEEKTAELERREKERDTRREKRISEVKAFLDEIENVVRGHEGATLDRERHVINFGSRAQFAVGRHDLTLEQANGLRRLVHELLMKIRRIETAKHWLKRIVAEGFTDDTWTYLDNLNLSLQRSQRVLCVLLAREWPPPVAPLGLRLPGHPPAVPPNTSPAELAPISEDDELHIRQLFLVGGYSSNSQKQSREESRRIELRIEFYQVDEQRIQVQQPVGPAGKCAVGAR